MNKPGAKRFVLSSDTSYGAWSVIPSPFLVEVLCHQGYDWIGIDLHHGLWGPDQMALGLQAASAASVPALVRVNGADRWEIMRALDAGAAGVIVPMTGSASEAREAVAACQYPPLGIRSYGPTRAALGHVSSDSSIHDQNVVCIVMIETESGVDNLKEILAVPGVDAIFVGPVDLSLTHGVFGDQNAREELVNNVFQVCSEVGARFGTTVSSPSEWKIAVDAGASFMVLDPDISLVSSGAQGNLARYANRHLPAERHSIEL